MPRSEKQSSTVGNLLTIAWSALGILALPNSTFWRMRGARLLSANQVCRSWDYPYGLEGGNRDESFGHPRVDSVNPVPLIRPFEPEDLEPVVSLWNDCLAKDRVTVELFWRLILLDPDFSSAGALVAESVGKPIGFLLSIAPKMGNQGRIAAFFVAPGHRRQGIGRTLLEAGIAHLRARGCRKATCNGHAPYYFFPGVDHDYTAALAFMTACGFEASAEAVAMNLRFDELTHPDGFRQREALLKEEGLEVRPVRFSDTMALLAFAESHYPDWRQSYVQGLQVDRCNVFVATIGERVVGFTQWQNPLTDPPAGVAGRFGPFGVHPDMRGSGIGSVIFNEVVAHLRARGVESLWLGWAGGRNLTFYERMGCQITRRFRMFSRDL
jgi:mycothiol synthase